MPARGARVLLGGVRGKAEGLVPAKLKDGEIATMVRLRNELGWELYQGKARIVCCFALDGRGKAVTGGPPKTGL